MVVAPFAYHEQAFLLIVRCSKILLHFMPLFVFRISESTCFLCIFIHYILLDLLHLFSIFYRGIFLFFFFYMSKLSRLLSWPVIDWLYLLYR